MISAFVAGAAALGSFAYALHTFTALVRLQHTNAHGSWVADGAPSGFFWRAPGSARGHGRVARERLSVTWLVGTPRWARNSDDARSLLHRMRVAVLGSNVMLVAALASAGLVHLR